jgi:hypothetical protein
VDRWKNSRWNNYELFSSFKRKLYMYMHFSIKRISVTWEK